MDSVVPLSIQIKVDGCLPDKESYFRLRFDCMRQGDQRFDGVPDQVLEEQVIPCLVM